MALQLKKNRLESWRKLETLNPDFKAVKDSRDCEDINDGKDGSKNEVRFSV